MIEERIFPKRITSRIMPTIFASGLLKRYFAMLFEAYFTYHPIGQLRQTPRLPALVLDTHTLWQSPLPNIAQILESVKQIG